MSIFWLWLLAPYLQNIWRCFEMTGRQLAEILRDILEEYRILEGSPLNLIEWIRVANENVVLLNPYILARLDTGQEF